MSARNSATSPAAADFQFQSPGAYAENLAGKPVFERLTAAAVDLFARATLALHCRRHA